MRSIKSGNLCGSVLKALMLAVLISCALFLHPDDLYLSSAAYQGSADIIGRISYMFEGRLLWFLSGVLLIAFLLFRFPNLFGLKHYSRTWREILFTLILGFWTAYGRLSLFRIQVNASSFQTLLFILDGTGYSILYSLFLPALSQLFASLSKQTSAGKPADIKLFLLRFCLIFLLWLPHLILKYPAGFCYDSAYQVDQALGNVPLSSSHPVFHTILMGWLVKIGIAAGDANRGMFLFVLLQTMLFASVLAFIAGKLNCWGISRQGTWAFLGFYTLCPYVAGYIGNNIKDELYAILFLLYLCSLLEIGYQGQISSRSGWIAFLVPTIFLGLIRHNGLGITIPIGLYMAIRHHGRSLKRLAVLFAAILTPLGVNFYMNSTLNPQSGSVAELLSIPFQQTARAASEYESTPEEREIINRVLPYDDLAGNYNRYISDPIKSLYRQSASKTDLISYLGVWFRQGLKHPLCYLSAFIEQNAQIFNPFYVNAYYYVYVNTDHYPSADPLLFSTPEWIQNLQPQYENYLYESHHLPFLRILGSAGLSMILLCMTFIQLRKDSAGHLFLLEFPFLMTFIYLVLGPTSAFHVRYMFPFIYGLPLLIGYAVLNKGKSHNGQKDEVIHRPDIKP